MGQSFLQPNIPKLVIASSTSLTLAATYNGQPTFLQVGGQGYFLTSGLSLSTAVTGIGGLDTGAIAANTAYYVYAVISSGVIGLVISTSSTAPTGFTQYQRLSAVVTNSSSALSWVTGFSSDGSRLNIEYASNSGSTATASGVNTTSTAIRSIAGSSILSIDSTTANATTNFRCLFVSTIQTDDILLMEFNDGNGWYEADAIAPYIIQSTSQYGVTMLPDNSTQVTVYFGNKGVKPNNATYAGNGVAWSTFTASNWRVKKISP